MKDMGKRMLAIVAIVLATSIPAIAGAPPPLTVGVPLDDGLWVLLIGGAAYAIKKFYSYKKKQ